MDKEAEQPLGNQSPGLNPGSATAEVFLSKTVNLTAPNEQVVHLHGFLLWRVTGMAMLFRLYSNNRNDVLYYSMKGISDSPRPEFRKHEHGTLEYMVKLN